MAGFGFGFGFSPLGALLNYNPENDEDINLLISGRSGFTLPASVGDSASIYTPTLLSAKSTLGNKTRSAEKFFNSGEYTFYCRFKLTVSTFTGSNYNFLKLGKTNLFSAASKGLAIAFTDVSNSNLNVYSSDGTTRFDGNVLTNGQNLIYAAGWCEMLVTVSFASKLISVSVYNDQGAQIGTTGTRSISTFSFFADDNAAAWEINNSQITSFDWKKFNAIKTITQCRDRSYTTDLQVYIPDLISGVDVSGNGNHMTPDTTMTTQDRIYDQKQSYLLDKGYTHYRGNTTTRKDVWIPNDLTGSEIAVTPFERTKDKTYSGQAEYHNGADSLIEFTGNEFDRSSTTRYNAFARVVNNYQDGFYNASTPKRWHPIELNRLKNQYMANSGYDGIVFVKMDGGSLIGRNYLAEVLTYSANKNVIDRDKVHQYCGDDVLMRKNSINMTTTIGDGVAADSGQYITESGANIYQVLTGGVVKKMSAGSLTSYSNSVSVSNGTYDVRILGELNKLEHWHTWDKNINVDITEFLKAPNIEYLGLLTPAPRKGFGCFSGMAKVKELWLNCPSIDEDDTFGYDGDIDTTPLLEVFESQWNYIDGERVFPVRRVTGSFENTNMRQFCAETLVGGDIGACTMEYLSWVAAGANTIHGDVSHWVECWWFSAEEGAESVTADTTGLVNLECFWPTLSMTKPANLQHMPKLSTFKPPWSLTAEEVNQYLADIWANRAVPRTVTKNTVADGYNNVLYRTITLTAGTTEAPTGQGLIDKAALQAYVSPTPPGDGVAFTVVTK